MRPPDTSLWLETPFGPSRDPAPAVAGAPATAVHLLRLPRTRSRILYGSCPGGRDSRADLVAILLQHLADLNRAWRQRLLRDPVRLLRGPLGRPLLRLAETPGPALSFSHTRNRAWAAVASSGSVGIDAARPEEFQGSYPFARAFRPGEFSLALGICRSGQEHAAALLWSLKEAAVKALGCGFHTLDPLALEARSPTAWDGGHLWRVRSEESLAVWVTRRKEAWLAVAHLEPCGQALES